MNATCERLIGTLRREFLDRMLVPSEAHLRTILTEYQAHYNCARPHQGIAQRPVLAQISAHLGSPGCWRQVPGGGRQGRVGGGHSRASG